MYEFWCGVILRDVIYYYFYYIRVTIKSLITLLYNFHQQNLKNNIYIKQTKIKILNESKPIVATSVSKLIKGI